MDKSKPEEWKKIPGYAGCRVSDAGRVKSPWKILTPGLAGAGYQVVTIHGCVCYVHRLVLRAFVGYSPLPVNHKNGIKTDNRLENLEYLSQGDNNRHAYATGLKEPSAAIGTKHPKAKLTQAQADEIRRRYAAEKIGMARLAKQYGVTKVVVSNLLKGSSYRPSQKEYATPIPRRKGRGEDNPQSKLTADQVSQIRERLKAGEHLPVIASEYHVSPATIRDIKHGRTWK